MDEANEPSNPLSIGEGRAPYAIGIQDEVECRLLCRQMKKPYPKNGALTQPPHLCSLHSVPDVPLLRNDRNPRADESYNLIPRKGMTAHLPSHSHPQKGKDF